MPISFQRIERDRKSALIAKENARSQLRTVQGQQFADDITGTFTRINKALRGQYMSDRESLIAIEEHPFHAMAEVKTVHANGRSSNAVWYANENTTTTQVLEDVIIVPWTHPGFQIAITEDIKLSYDINDPRYNLSEITPLARARFQKVIPEIIGIYDPGGHVGQIEKISTTTGLKAVKLHMTKDQVKAFISKMKGVLFVTGAPGSGKTTVAFQRMRFLYDEGDQKTEVEHSPDNSKVFLANENLINHSKDLLEKHLDIPSSIISLVKDFTEEYLNDAWRFKHDALFLSRDISNILNRRARESFFSTCPVDDIKECWKTYELQIVERMSEVSKTEWAAIKYRKAEKSESLNKLIDTICEFVRGMQKKRPSIEPHSSEVNMDRFYRHCAHHYEEFRNELTSTEVEQFDGLFLKWLYFVYDPLDCLLNYFNNRRHEGALRIRRGTGSRADEEHIIRQIMEDWRKRQYRRQEIAWLAWLLRFALPTADDQKNRFRDMPNAYSPIANKYGPWSHVVIDEAQDLSVVEASLISSFVVRNGALTISADFKQVVSPVHGMESLLAFRVGCHLVGRDDEFNRFPFTKNMRQTYQIGNFLRNFYEKVFGELPQFVANDELSGSKPQLHLMPYMNYAATLKKALNVMQRQHFDGTCALLQINEDEDEMNRYRTLFEQAGIALAPIWSSEQSDGHLITTSVERIKGLEYDACFVIGMEKADDNSLNFNRNRVYVALSRPTKRLFMLCEYYPSLLRDVNQDLFDVYDLRNVF